ncbi:MFS general substrate transporter [Phanerochaete sordida]|uniref:MFS general substrate transporter n=1 Tax=Phanerochaete sordida TaxID=48140 RepID=A0A9P3G6T7_9APHY|nr:MFS general substrate transporter [Phanerochaete sordida]
MSMTLPTLQQASSSTDLSIKNNTPIIAEVPALHHGDDAAAMTAAVTVEDSTPKRGLHFWLVMVAIWVSVFLSALEYTSVSTALPTIVHDLQGEDFVWVPSAYVLAATALLPATGGVAEVFGRRLSMIAVLALFAFGSALCGAAQSMNWLIAARAIQGAGGGGILSVTAIIIADLVPLRERAIFIALLGLVWAGACAIGPSVGGALAKEGQWRWLFYLNLPINGVAAALVLIFLRLKTPRGALLDKVKRLDWVGNVLIIASSSACVIGLTWGGVQFPWTSAHVLAPLILGLVGIIGFLVYEALVASEPLVPFELISNRTSLSGYIQTFIAPIVVVAVIYYLPVYYQACKLATSLHAGVELLAICLVIGPVIIISGVSITKAKVYRPQLWLGWIFLMLAMGAMSTLKADSSTSASVGLPSLVGIGGGFLYQATYYPVLAPLPISQNARAMALFSFCRIFAGVWGVTIGTAVLQTQLTSRLPADFLQTFPQGVAVAYSIIPVIPSLEEPLQTQVREAFADAIAVVWRVMIGIAGIGFLASLAMKSLPLHTQVDRKWGLEQDMANAKSGAGHEMEPQIQEA